MTTVIHKPYYDAQVVTKSDATIIPVTRGLYVGGTGNVNVRTFNGTTVLISAVPVGAILPIAVDQVLSTSTTATLILALY